MLFFLWQHRQLNRPFVDCGSLRTEPGDPPLHRPTINPIGLWLFNNNKTGKERVPKQKYKTLRNVIHLGFFYFIRSSYVR
jgi:hypothetical protein